jgi:N-acetylmuramoyl-L-alanine amidase
MQSFKQISANYKAILIVFVTLVGSHSRAFEPPNNPKLIGPYFLAEQTEKRVFADGLVIDAREGTPQSMSGPALPGELEFIGSFVPGLVPTGDRPSVAARFPKGFDGTKGQKRQPGARPSESLVVIIDPGHGGKEPGAISKRGYKEKQFALSVAKKAEAALAKIPGITVVLTRTGDDSMTLSDRATLANQVGADLFISLHANAFKNRRWGGFETFFHSLEASGEEARRVASKENAQDMASAETGDDEVSVILQDMKLNERLKSSSRLAQVVQKRLAGALEFNNRGVMQADFAVLRQTRMPAILVELGFMTNPQEEQLLREPKIQEQVAIALRDAIVDYRVLLEKQEVQKPSEASR